MRTDERTDGREPVHLLLVRMKPTVCMRLRVVEWNAVCEDSCFVYQAEQEVVPGFSRLLTASVTLENCPSHESDIA